jgi:integrase
MSALTEQYDKRLERMNLPAGGLLPQPTRTWPAENIALLEEYAAWLHEGGAGEHATQTNYLPTAALILGLNLKPHSRINLTADLEKAVDFTRLRGLSANKIKTTGHGAEKFRRFLRFKRGLGEVIRIKSFDVAAHTLGLPEWLAQELIRYQLHLQKNWREARVFEQTCNFWDKHLHVWKYLCFEKGVRELADIQRSHLIDLMAADTKKGYAVATINVRIQLWKGFLNFLRTNGLEVPPWMFLVKTLKQPEALPKYLPDDEMARLREAIEQGVAGASGSCALRDALLTQAAFYLLWHGGLRLGEAEDLLLADIDFPGRRLTVRNGKGQKDRTVYLTDVAVAAFREYLAVRGPANAENLLIYSHAPMNKELIDRRLRAIGKRLGIRLHPHRLRHTAATELINANCELTTIQKVLGHKSLDTTLRYARAHDQTVADNFYAAMERVDEALAIESEEGQLEDAPLCPEDVKVQVLAWIEILAKVDVSHNDRQMIAASLKRALFRDLPGGGLPAG